MGGWRLGGAGGYSWYRVPVVRRKTTDPCRGWRSYKPGFPPASGYDLQGDDKPASQVSITLAAAAIDATPIMPWARLTSWVSQVLHNSSKEVAGEREGGRGGGKLVFCVPFVEPLDRILPRETGASFTGTIHGGLIALFTLLLLPKLTQEGVTAFCTDCLCRR